MFVKFKLKIYMYSKHITVEKMKENKFFQVITTCTLIFFRIRILLKKKIYFNFIYNSIFVDDNKKLTMLSFYT